MNPNLEYRFSQRKPSAVQNYTEITKALDAVNPDNIVVRHCFVRPKTIRGSGITLSRLDAIVMLNDIERMARQHV